MKPKPFSDFDLSGFWSDSDYSKTAFVEEPPDEELIASIEQKLGYKLPVSYVELMKMQNGGIPSRTSFPMTEPTSCAEDHIAITGIMGIGRTKIYSLCGSHGSRFMINQWGYPDIGVCVCNCPSAGHDMIMLDYSSCGKTGEPTVVHVNQEEDYKKTLVAKDFETFVRGLVSEDVFDTSAEDLKQSLQAIESGRFSDVLEQLFDRELSDDFRAIFRNVLLVLTRQKGFFALHADDTSMLVYDLQFHLFSRHRVVTDRDSYLEAYPDMLTFSNGDVSTKGYDPSYVTDWLDQRLSNGQIVRDSSGGLTFSADYTIHLLGMLGSYR